MKNIVETEVRDMRAANRGYAIEIERNQALFRELQKETLDQLDERKL
jgi:hypothetical protein